VEEKDEPSIPSYVIISKYLNVYQYTTSYYLALFPHAWQRRRDRGAWAGGYLFPDPKENYLEVRLTATERREAGELGRGNPR
jgi:hypothetical protein